MRPIARHHVARRGAAVLVCAIFGLLIVPGAVTAASVTFGTPAFKSTFGRSIVFSQPYTGSGITEVAIAIEAPGDIGPSLISLQTQGRSVLSYTLDTSNGGLAPFQPLTAHFVVTFTDGTVQAGPDIHLTYADDRFNWKSASGKFVTIHWIEGSDTFGQTLLGYGEQAVPKSAAFFGITETKRADFYIYNNQSSFQTALGVSETIGGQAEAQFRICYAQVGPTDLAYGSTVVPHELTHIVFNDVTDNPYHSPPRWLNEGLAVYLSEGYGSDNRALVSRAARSGTLVPLAALAGYFALDSARIFLSYAEAVSAVDFMVRKYGKAAIQKLAASYATGTTDDEAFKAALGVDTAAFDKAWLADNGVTASQTYGPQPAPTGPIPPGWNGSTETAPPVAPPSTIPGAGPANGRQNPPDDSDSAAYIMAGLVLLGGLVVLAAGIVLHVLTTREQWPSGRPPT
ncbi:MAG: peptidase MA family metallohydrolase [Candidatus Limnocylindrales bacterium]